MKIMVMFNHWRQILSWQQMDSEEVVEYFYKQVGDIVASKTHPKIIDATTLKRYVEMVLVNSITQLAPEDAISLVVADVYAGFDNFIKQTAEDIIDIYNDEQSYEDDADIEIVASSWRKVLAWQELTDYDQIRTRFETEVYDIILETIPGAIKEEVINLINTVVGWPSFEDKEAVASIIIDYVYAGWNNLVTETATIILETLKERYKL